jgi:hypothetical protein
MASGDTLLVFTPNGYEAPASAFSQLDSRNAHPVVAFDASSKEGALFTGIMPHNYGGGGVNVILWWISASATTGAVVWNSSFERNDTGTNVTSDHFATAQAVTTTTAGTSGLPVSSTIAHSSGAQMSSVVAGDQFRIKIERDAANASDTMSGDAQLMAIEIREQ